jgi:hypothetical protein
VRRREKEKESEKEKVMGREEKAVGRQGEERGIEKRKYKTRIRKEAFY